MDNGQLEWTISLIAEFGPWGALSFVLAEALSTFE